MARRLFFVPQIREGLAELTGTDAEHLVRVLRAETGEVYEISDNVRACLAKVQSACKSSVIFEVIDELPSLSQRATVNLFPALFKFDHFEWMVEKVTELGVTTLETFGAVRSERGLKQAAAKRVERWRKIALEASQQSRRRTLPEVAVAESLESILARDFDWKILLDESTKALPLLSLVGQREKSASDRVGIVLGPEGGWTDLERDEFLNVGWSSCSLGSTILRSETAAVAALSVVNALWRR